MNDVSGAATANDQMAYRGLRDWIEKVDGLGELLRVAGEADGGGDLHG